MADCVGLRRDPKTRDSKGSEKLISWESELGKRLKDSSWSL